MVAIDKLWYNKVTAISHSSFVFSLALAPPFEGHFFKMRDILIVILLIVVLAMQQFQVNSNLAVVAKPATSTRTPAPTFTPTPTPSPTIAPTPTVAMVELVVFPTATSPTPTQPPKKVAAKIIATSTAIACHAKLPGAKSYGVADCLLVSVFNTIGYKQTALSLGEHRANGDLRDSSIKCLAMNPWGDVTAVGDSKNVWQVASDGGTTSDGVPIAVRGGCLWSPNGVFLAVQAIDTVWIVPHFDVGYEEKKWPLFVGIDETGASLVGWTIDNNILLRDGSGSFWLCHPISGCMIESAGKQIIAGVDQWGLPHFGGYEWVRE